MKCFYLTPRGTFISICIYFPFSGTALSRILNVKLYFFHRWYDPRKVWATNKTVSLPWAYLCPQRWHEERSPADKDAQFFSRTGTMCNNSNCTLFVVNSIMENKNVESPKAFEHYRNFGKPEKSWTLRNMITKLGKSKDPLVWGNIFHLIH